MFLCDSLKLFKNSLHNMDKSEQKVRKNAVLIKF